MSTPTIKCPTCGRPVEWTEAFPFRPFCSERCRLIDLGAWFNEERGIAGDEAPGDDEPGDRNPPGQ